MNMHRQKLTIFIRVGHYVRAVIVGPSLGSPRHISRLVKFHGIEKETEERLGYLQGMENLWNRPKSGNKGLRYAICHHFMKFIARDLSISSA